MSYIVRVVGYNAYWTGNTEPGKLWSNSIQESKLFDTKKEAEVIVNSGNNMESVDYDFASLDIQRDVFNWDEVDKKAKEYEPNKQEVVTIPPQEFEASSDEIHQVDVEVLD